MVEPTGYTALDLIGFTDRGDYDPSAYYVKNDLVHDGVDNIWRVLIDDTHGVTPAEGLNYTIFIRNHGTEAEEIIAPVESNPAAAAHAVGTQLIYDGDLYEVTKAIAVSDSLVAYPTSGYNIKAAGTVASQIQTLSTQSNSIAPTEDGANYSTSYIKGAQFYRNGVLYEVTASSVNSSTAINTGSGGNAKTADTVCAQLVSLSESETQTVAGITFKRIGESVVYYGNLTGLANTSYVNIGIAPFLPTEAYSIDNFYNSSAPYTPIGTIWINGSGGAMTIYKDSAKTSGYVSGSYICHL